MNEPLDHAREKLRDEFEQLRGEIEELHAEESGGDDSLARARFRGRAGASVAVLALSAAIAAAAGNFALNGGRTPKEGTVSVPLPSGEPEPSVIAADRGSAEPSSSLLSLPGLQTGILGSNARPPSASPATTGPSPLFVVGDPISASGHGSRSGDVAGGDPVGKPPAPTPPAPEPDAPLAFSPPPAPAAGTGKGEVPDDGGKPGSGGNTAVTLEDHPGGGGDGPPAKGHVKASGKGHGGSPGKGHEKDQGDGEIVDSGPDDKGSPGHGHGHRGGGGRGGGPPTATTTAPPAPGPPPPGPGLGPDGNPGKGGGPDHGKSAAPGQSGK